MRSLTVVPLGFLLLLAAMLTGYMVKKIEWGSPASARQLMVRLQKYVYPFILVFSFWGVEFRDRTLFFLPLTGFAVIVMQYAMARGACALLGLKGTRRGTFLVSAILSNIGYLGWPINLWLFGKLGFDYAFLYGFYFNLAIYFVVYPLAARHADRGPMKGLPFIKRLTVEGIFFVTVLAILGGIVLNLSGIRRPGLFGEVSSMLVFLVTLAMMFAAGLTVRFRLLGSHAKPCAAIMLIKLILSPLLVSLGLLFAAGWMGMNPLMVKVVIIQSMMPCAIACLSVSAIFHLDQDLANSIWISSTLFFFIVLQCALWMMGRM